MSGEGMKRRMYEQLCILRHYLYYKYWLRFRDRAGLKRWQKRRLRRHLSFVARHSAIYRGKRRLEDFPKIDKSFMMRNFKELNTVGIGRKEAEDFAVRAERERDFVPRLRGVTVGLSSGTSGRRGIFLVSEAERMRWAGYILAKFLPGSIRKAYSIAFFMRADSNLYQSVGSRRIRFYFFDIYRDMEEHRKRLEEIRPQILVGQPSVLLMLAEEQERGTLRICPERVISIAEVLEKADEARLKRVFGQEVIHQVYQCTEGCLAATCRCGTLHLNEDVVYIEREYLDECRFVPVVTDFERRAQPIIRYRLNDILKERKEPCNCKSPCLALEKIEGREDDVFIFQGKEGGQKRVFPDFIRRCMLFAEKGEDCQKYRKADICGGKEPADDGENPSDKETGYGGGEGEYRIVQERDGRILVYADLTATGQQRVREEFMHLAEEQRWILPKLLFRPYVQEQGKKMKRVERRCQNHEDTEEGENRT